MIEFIKEMTVGNVHAFWHFAGGMIFYNFFYWVSPSRDKNKFALLMTLAVAILYEIVTLYLYGHSGYSGGLQGYIADSLGDIILAVLGAWVIRK